MIIFAPTPIAQSQITQKQAIPIFLAIRLCGVDEFNELCELIDELIKNDKLREALALYSTLAERFPRVSKSFFCDTYNSFFFPISRELTVLSQT